MLGRIWRKIWQRIQQLWQRWFSKPEPPPPPEPELPPLSDAGYERLFFQLLDGVAAGWQSPQVISHLNRRETDRFFRSWLQRFGQKLLESPEPNRELARRMVRLAESLAAWDIPLAIGNRADWDEIRLRGLHEPAQAGLDSVDAISIAPSPNPQPLPTLIHQIHEIGQQLQARELPPLPEDEYEPMFQRLLAEAARGEAAVLAFLTDLSPRVAAGQWEAWLRGYGEGLLAEAEPNPQIARGLIRLGEVLAGISPDSPEMNYRELGKLAEEIGREMKAREVVWEIWEYEERVGEAGDAEGWFEEGNRLYRTHLRSSKD